MEMWIRFRYFLRLFQLLFRTSLIAELEFRANIILKIVTDVIWYMIQLSIFEVLYLHTDQISGWTAPMMRVFLGCIFVTDALTMWLFSLNFDQFTDRIRKGELDLILAKPVPSQFMMSLYRMQPSYLINLLISTLWLVATLYGFHGNQEGNLNLLTPLLMIFVLVLGTILMYALRFILLTFSIGMGRAESLMQLWYVLYRFSMKPNFFFPPWTQRLLKTLLPLSFVSFVPAQILLDQNRYQSLVMLVGITGTALVLSVVLWNRSLQEYSSASS